MQNIEFQELIWRKGSELYREMLWRKNTRPYYVLVSELMLQQTQVARVIPKFEAFVAKFPDEKILAKASLADVLKFWQGLGYNTRAKYLHEAAKMIVGEFGGIFPSSETELLKLPGVGKNTAGAILAYSFNQPSIFVETNVRTVYIHHFFNDHFDVNDAQLIKKLEQTIDKEHPREFYWALMDYGSYLKQQGVKNIHRSSHYKKQSPLEGSVRQVRGMIVKALTEQQVLTIEQLKLQVVADKRFDEAFTGLVHDGLITEYAGTIYLTK